MVEVKLKEADLLNQCPLPQVISEKYDNYKENKFYKMNLSKEESTDNEKTI